MKKKNYHLTKKECNKDLLQRLEIVICRNHSFEDSTFILYIIIFSYDHIIYNLFYKLYINKKKTYFLCIINRSK